MVLTVIANGVKQSRLFKVCFVVEPVLSIYEVLLTMT